MSPVLSPTTDQRVTYRDRTWAQFKLIQKGLEDCPGVRLFYSDGTVEVLMPGGDHEFFKSVIGFLLELFFIELLTRCILLAETSRLEAARVFHQGI